ncbi:MAG: hypothetical protein J6A01_02310, partial [Proteobacteria bacterium]|nr:hypothetical protein [Pseudomonadota bacterium]
MIAATLFCSCSDDSKKGEDNTCTQDKCEGWCGDFKSDPKHCGNCETDCTIYEGVTGTCSEGKCVFTAALCKDETDSSGNVTQRKKICIKDGNPVCADIDNDPNNCGECGNKCTGDSPTCANGVCGEKSCQETTCIDADGNSICVNLNTDNKYCGSCENVCKPNQHCDRTGEIAKCVANDCKDACLKDEILNLGIEESAYIDIFGNTESVCIDPGNPVMCGINTCEALKQAISNKQLGCDGELICRQASDNSSQYACSCRDGSFMHGKQCLKPTDNRSCGATADNPG